mmetsp:Transcript_11886/g.34232  ORF Transcript_11886/g.34232 Transcript_11886/m.34232 type:complete len:247 (-) Transcript_11886:194-934(-)
MLVHLETPLPDALAGFQHLRQLLLQAVLHAHQYDLPLRRLLFLHLAVGARPVRRGSRDRCSDHRRRLRIQRVQLFIAGALEVPKHAPRHVSACRRLRRFGHACELMEDAKQLDVHKGGKLPPDARLGPDRTAAAHIAREAKRLQDFHIGGLIQLWRLQRLDAVLQQLLAPLPDVEVQRAVRGVPLPQLLRGSPASNDVVRQSVHEKGDSCPKLEGRGSGHALLVAPLQHGAALGGRAMPGTLDEFL